MLGFLSLCVKLSINDGFVPILFFSEKALPRTSDDFLILLINSTVQRCCNCHVIPHLLVMCNEKKDFFV